MSTATPRLLAPGWLPREPGLETYWVRPGGLTCVRVDPDDQLTVIDTEGRQRAEVVHLPVVPGDPVGERALDLVADAPATVLADVARRAEQRPWDTQLADVVDLVLQRGADPSACRAAVLFGPWSPAGSRETFTAAGAALVLVSAPDRVMLLDEVDANPATPVQLEVRRARPRARSLEALPPPLVEPVLDQRIDAATAFAYEVGKGQYIQVIDVAGRQCSDFLAFGARQLADGVERGLDSTTTRTITGTAYPAPGLSGKFYDQDARPLVEVVRDLVGRHDTFGLACNAKYYEEFGYPGHVNCTDNFNTELARYGVEARRGWPALNLFYNTAFDAQHQLVVDEPWSRPGDYVMFRALQDLVCASSACPDDVDASNAWMPTDIHLRVYDTHRPFTRAVAHRATPEREPTLTKDTAFRPRLDTLTDRFTEYAGYWLPTSYASHGTVEEYWGCRERVAVMDLSPLRKFEVLGPDAQALLQLAVTRDVRRLCEGQVVYTALCNDTGGMVDDGTVFRIADTNFRFVGGSDRSGIWLRELAERSGLDRVWVKDSTDQLHNLAVQGPASRDLLAELIWTPPGAPEVRDLRWFRFVVGRLQDAEGIPVLVSRTGFTGELGYELFVHPSHGPGLWDAVWAAGEPHGLVPLGLDALEMLRIEAGLVVSGNEFDDQTDPFEAGIGFTVPLRTKDDDFVGREALLSRKAHPQRTLVGLELAGNEPAGHGDCVHVGRTQVGVVTSGTRSPILRSTIALCRIAVQYAEPGTQVEVGKLDGHAKRIPARVVSFPFYDPGKERPRS